MSADVPKMVNELSKRIERLEQAVFGGGETRSGISTTDVDIGGLGHVKKLKAAADKCLAVLDDLFSKNPNHAGLTPDEFAAVFREKFGLPIPLSTISSQLYKQTGRYVTRKKISGKPVKYRYQILPRGQEYIRNKIASLQG